jgi:hypothetical protein
MKIYPTSGFTFAPSFITNVPQAVLCSVPHTHTHTHTHIYIRVYMYMNITLTIGGPVALAALNRSTPKDYVM